LTLLAYLVFLEQLSDQLQYNTNLPGVDRMLFYLCQHPYHILRLGPSGHPEASLGIWAIAPLLFELRGTTWKDNILCQHGGCRLPLSFIELQDYLTDCASSWTRFKKDIDGQLDSTYSISDEGRGLARASSGHNNEENILCLVGDISYGTEPSFAYCADFWQDKLLNFCNYSSTIPYRMYSKIQIYPGAPSFSGSWIRRIPSDPPPCRRHPFLPPSIRPHLRSGLGHIEHLQYVNLNATPVHQWKREYSHQCAVDSGAALGK